MPILEASDGWTGELGEMFAGRLTPAVTAGISNGKLLGGHEEPVVTADVAHGKSRTPPSGMHQSKEGPVPAGRAGLLYKHVSRIAPDGLITCFAEMNGRASTTEQPLAAVQAAAAAEMNGGDREGITTSTLCFSERACIDSAASKHGYPEAGRVSDSQGRYMRVGMTRNGAWQQQKRVCVLRREHNAVGKEVFLDQIQTMAVEKSIPRFDGRAVHFNTARACRRGDRDQELWLRTLAEGKGVKCESGKLSGSL
ncbi:hypothetical protein CDD83_2979 [Cordyceps sp. RAO-2017]|nr:hypothetical protein CDD83_2979 [Cordyceps sp. RAO-2017]